jgi:hypothetical protein
MRQDVIKEQYKKGTQNQNNLIFKYGLNNVKCVKRKGKAIPATGRGDPWGYMMSRLPYF